MCLVFIAYGIDGCPPVMIGANREESPRRPMTSPVCCRVRSLRCLLAGADHGPDGTFPQMGTWLGVNEAGIAVAVTNRHDGELAWEDQTRSRGLLTVDLLGFDHPDPASRFAREELGQGGFGGCNYLIAGADAAFVVQAPSAGRVSVTALTPGIHAMTNLELDDPDDPRIRFVAETLHPRDFPSSAGSICRDERIVIPDADFGTVSSSLIFIDEAIAMDHIPGDPRDREYRRFRLPDGATGHYRAQGSIL
ncbi:MAG: NRDE family protein [Isosphaeraceae bacterium]